MLRKIHIEKISKLVAENFLQMGALKGPVDQAEAKIATILAKNMEEERALDDEAQKLLLKHKKAAGMEFDDQKAFALIRKELAKQRGFVL